MNSKRISLGIIVLSISNILFSFLIMPIFVSILFPGEYGSDPIVLILVQFLGSIIPLLLVLYLVYGKDAERKLTSIIKPKNITVREVMIILVLSVISFFMVKMFSISIENVMVLTFKQPPPSKFIYNFDGIHFTLLLLAYAIIPGIYEEITYRGLYYEGGSSKIVAFLLSVIPFAFMHYPILNILNAFVLGSIYFFIREKKNSVFYLVIMHITNNILAIIFANYIILPIELVYTYQSTLTQNDTIINILNSLIFFVVFFWLLIFGMSFLKNDNNQREKLSNKISLITLLIVCVLYTTALVVNLIISL